MEHFALTGMTSDPRSGVVTDHKSVHVVLDKKDMVDVQESVVRKLNSNINKFYPDAGGIMMGYQGIKLKKSTSEVTASNTHHLLHPVYIRAKFFLFKPQVGSELQCVVDKRVDGLVTCLAHGVFKVEVVNPPQAWENVFVGQIVIVKVDAIEQLAWQEPKIVASLMEISDDIKAQFFDIVESFDEEEVETVTDSGMFEYENNKVINDRSRAQVTISSTSSGEDHAASPLNVKKRKAKDESKVDDEEAAKSPVIKKRKSSKIAPVAEPSVSESIFRRTRHSSKSSVDSEISPTSQSSSSDHNIDKLCHPHSHPVTPSSPLQLPVNSNPQPSTSTSSTPPSSELLSPSKKKQKSLLSPESFSPGKKNQTKSSPELSSSVEENQKSKPSGVSSSPIKKRTSTKLLSKILPKPSKLNSADSGNDTDNDDEQALNEDNLQHDNVVTENSIITADSTGEAFLCKISALTQSSETLASEPAPPSPKKTPVKLKTSKDRKCCPPGFIDNTVKATDNKKARVHLRGPTGERFTSYVAAWKWLDNHPEYFVKEEVTSDRELPSATVENQHEPVEITPVAAPEASEKSISESPKKKSKLRKPPKKFVPTPVLEATSKKQSEQLPAPDSTPEVPESQNLLAMESETDYQSQSLLEPVQPATVPNKVKKSPKVASDKTSLKKADAESKKGSSKSEFFSLGEGVTSVPASNSNVDTLRTSTTTSSDSSDDSDNEENISQVTIPAKQTAVPPIPPSSDSSSYDSESSDDEQTIVSKTPTRPSETVANKLEESSDSSDSDSSEESPKTAETNKSNNAATGSATLPTLSGDKGAKKLGDSAAQKQGNTNPAKKQSSSSSSSDSEEESPKPVPAVPKKKKMTKTKNSPKSASKINTSTQDDKSPHLSSTVVSGVERLKDKMSVPDGISPILKSRHKPKADESYFDRVMANSKIGSQSSENIQAGIESGTSDKNSNVKDGKSIKNDKNANKKKKKKEKPPGFL